MSEDYSQKVVNIPNQRELHPNPVVAVHMKCWCCRVHMYKHLGPEKLVGPKVNSLPDSTPSPQAIISRRRRPPHASNCSSTMSASKSVLRTCLSTRQPSLLPRVQCRHESTARRHKKLLALPEAPSYTPSRSEPSLIFNPPSSAPSVYHTPLKFLPKDDKRRQLYSAALSSPTRLHCAASPPPSQHPAHRYPRARISRHARAQASPRRCAHRTRKSTTSTTRRSKRFENSGWAIQRSGRVSSSRRSLVAPSSSSEWWLRCRRRQRGLVRSMRRRGRSGGRGGERRVRRGEEEGALGEGLVDVLPFRTKGSYIRKGRSR